MTEVYPKIKIQVIRKSGFSVYCKHAASIRTRRIASAQTMPTSVGLVRRPVPSYTLLRLPQVPANDNENNSAIARTQSTRLCVSSRLFLRCLFDLFLLCPISSMFGLAVPVPKPGKIAAAEEPRRWNGRLQTGPRSTCHYGLACSVRIQRCDCV